MDENKKYIQNVKIEDVPWDRLSTAYGMAARIPGYLNDIWDMKNMGTVKTALSFIEENIEHQATLWHSTPFTMIFLTRIFDHMAQLAEQNKIAGYIAHELLDFFIIIVKSCSFYNDIGESEKIPLPLKHLPLFSDMLDEQYLYPEDEENEDEFWDMYNDFPDEFLDSFYFYSLFTLQCYKDIPVSNFPSFMEPEITKLKSLL